MLSAKLPSCLGLHAYSFHSFLAQTHAQKFFYKLRSYSARHVYHIIAIIIIIIIICYPFDLEQAHFINYSLSTSLSFGILFHSSRKCALFLKIANALLLPFVNLTYSPFLRFVMDPIPLLKAF